MIVVLTQIRVSTDDANKTNYTQNATNPLNIAATPDFPTPLAILCPLFPHSPRRAHTSSQRLSRMWTDLDGALAQALWQSLSIPPTRDSSPGIRSFPETSGAGGSIRQFCHPKDPNGPWCHMLIPPDRSVLMFVPQNKPLVGSIWDLISMSPEVKE